MSVYDYIINEGFLSNLSRKSEIKKEIKKFVEAFNDEYKKNKASYDKDLKSDLADFISTSKDKFVDEYTADDLHFNIKSMGNKVEYRSSDKVFVTSIEIFGGNDILAQSYGMKSDRKFLSDLESKLAEIAKTVDDKVTKVLLQGAYVDIFIK